MPVVLMRSSIKRGPWLKRRGKVAVVEELNDDGNYWGTNTGLPTFNYVRLNEGMFGAKILQRYVQNE